MKQMHKRYRVTIVIQEIIEEPDKLPVERVVGAKSATQIVNHLEFNKISSTFQHEHAGELLRASAYRVVRELASVFACDIKS